MGARLIIILLSLFFAAGLLWREDKLRTFSSFEGGWISWLRANTGREEQAPDVTFVRIDDSGDRIFESWPLSPGDYALLLRNLNQYAPPSIALVPSLRWSERGLLFDSLVGQLSNARGVVLGAEVEHITEEASFADPAIGGLFESFPHVTGDIAALPVFTGLVGLPQDQMRGAGALAITAMQPEPFPMDGVNDLKLPLLARYGERVVPSLVLRTAMAMQGLAVTDVEVVLGRHLSLGERKVRIDLSGAMRVDLSLLKRISQVQAATLLLGANPDLELLSEGESLEALEALRGHAVVVGLDDPASRAIDVGGEPVSLARILGAGVGTLQVGAGVQRLSREIELSLCVALGFLGVWIAAQFSTRSFLFGLLGLLGIAVSALLLYQEHGLWFSPLAPAVLLVIPILAGLLRPIPVTEKSGEQEEVEA